MSIGSGSNCKMLNCNLSIISSSSLNKLPSCFSETIFFESIDTALFVELCSKRIGVC